MILLDTHAWIWLASEPARLGPVVGAALVSTDERSLGVSAISGWEIATKVAQGKLGLDRSVTDWVGGTQHQFRIVCESVSMPIALRSGGLGAEGFHGDPADRIIVATAMLLRCPLATLDDKIRDWAATRSDLTIVW
jgi:PIN domain nuclease of toxin-antitoxin system